MPALRPTLATLLLAASTASAAITIPTVSVGNAGNVPDPATGNQYGSVDYDYHIGKYEVTNRQYTAFLNAVAATDSHGLYNSKMGSNPRGGISQNGSAGNYSYSTRTNMADKPVNYVSFWSAARFANWLTNGQTTGAQNNSTTETGMYNLGGAANPDNETVTRQIDFSAGEKGVAVASENEWYKAAYYDGEGGYYDFPTQSDDNPTVATADATGYVRNPGTNVANYNFGADWNSKDGNVTTVGSAEAPSHYGTFDQAGNVWELNDEIISDLRGVRGGSFKSDKLLELQSSGRFGTSPDRESGRNGFRVTSLAPIPEPSSYGAIFGIVGLATAVFFRRRRRSE